MGTREIGKEQQGSPEHESSTLQSQYLQALQHDLKTQPLRRPGVNHAHSPSVADSVRCPPSPDVVFLPSFMQQLRDSDRQCSVN